MSRELLKPTPVKVIKKLVTNEDSKLPSSSNNDFLSVEEGSNKFRIMPKLPGDDAFYRMRCIHWLTINGDDGKERRTTVQNAIEHGGQKKDIIEEYINFVQQNLDSSDADDEAKIKALTAWEGGLGKQTSWVCYAYKVKQENMKFGLLEMKKTVRDQMNRETIIEDEDEALEVDPFTDPDTGKPVIIKMTKEKKKVNYSVTLSKNPMPLTDDQVDEYLKKKPLRELSLLSYSNEDFEKSLEGIRFFDEKHEINLFDSEDFQEIVKELKKNLKKNNTDTLKKPNMKKVEDDEDEEEDDVKPVIKKTSKKPIIDEDEEEEEEIVKPKSKKKPILVEEDDEEEEEEEEVVIKPKAKKKPIVVEEDDDDDDEEEEEEVDHKAELRKKIQDKLKKK